MAGLCGCNVGHCQDWVDDDYLIRATPPDQFAMIVRRAAQATAAKSAFNEEIRQARDRFFEGCTRRVRDATAATDFASLLLQKDIYYLSLYLFEGMTTAAEKRVEATDTLTGGALDDGLTAQGLFGTWTEAVRRAMHAPPSGQFWIPRSPGDALAAIQSATPEYAVYQQARDRHEFDRWRMMERKAAGTIATTPEQRADRYDEYVLEPEIQKTLGALPTDRREEARSRLTAWAAELHKAIIGFETMNATPELVGDFLRDGHYPDDIVQSAQASFAAMHPADTAAAVSVLAQARQQLDARRDPRSLPLEPSLPVLDLALHSFAYARGAGRLTPDEAAKLPPGRLQDRLTYLFLAARPPYRCCTFYSWPRHDIITGAIYKEPPALQPGIDPCTGTPMDQEASAAVKPSTPRAPPEPTTTQQASPAGPPVKHDVVAFDESALGDNNFKAAQAMGSLLPNGASKWSTYQQVVDMIVRSGKYRILNCSYGPNVYHFWTGTVPPYFSQLVYAVTVGGVLGDAARLGTKPVLDCPRNETGAEALQQTLAANPDRPNVNALPPEEQVMSLSHQRVGAISRSGASYQDWENIVTREKTERFNQEVDTAIAAKQQIIECDFPVYGFTKYFFYWYKSAPANVTTLIGLPTGYNGAISHMGTSGRMTCPNNLGDANTAFNQLTQESRPFVRY